MTLVRIQHDDAVGNIKVVTRTADNENRRHVMVLVERSDLVDERSDGLFVFRNKLHHLVISNHKVCRTGVLVDEKRCRSHFKGLCIRVCGKKQSNESDGE